MGWWPLVFVAPWPLLAAVQGRSAVRRLALGSLAGLVWAECTVFPWLYPAARSHLAAGPLAAVGLAGGAAWLYGGMYLAGFALVYPWLPRPRWLTATATWVLGEAVRAEALGGAAWGDFGHSLHASLPLAQLAELTGVPGLSVLALLPAAALAESGAERWRGLGVWAVALAVTTGFGLYRLAGDPVGLREGSLPVVVVGGHNADPDPLRAYLAATALAPPSSLTIWPEASLPGYLQEDAPAAAAIRALARARGWVLLGAMRYDGAGKDRRYFNSALLFDPDGNLHDGYDKGRLVPFAERSPWPLPSVVARPFSPGAERPRPLAAGPLRVGVLVCWESIFTEPARGYARQGVDVLVNPCSTRTSRRSSRSSSTWTRSHGSADTPSSWRGRTSSTPAAAWSEQWSASPRCSVPSPGGCGSAGTFRRVSICA